MGWGTDMVNNVVEGVQNAGSAVVDGVQSAASSTADGFDSACDWVHDQLTPDIRPEGTNGHQIYVWFHHGPGTGSLDEAVQGWGKVSEKHNEVAAELDGALGMMRSSWQGEAAEAAQSSVRPLRDAADTAGSRCQEAGKVLEAQSSGFNETKKNVVDVPSEPPTMNPLTTAANPAGYMVEAQNYQAQQQQNQMSLRGYGDTTGGNAGAVPAFDGHKEPSTPPPPDGRQSGDGTGVGGFGGHHSGDGSGSNVARPGGSGANYSTPAGTDQAGSCGNVGSGSGTTGSGAAGGGASGGGGSTGAGHSSGSGSASPSGTRSAWWSQREDGDTGSFGGEHRGAVAGAAGGAGLLAGGAVLGGGLLGGRAEGAGISGRGVPGVGTGVGTGAGTGTGVGAGGRSGTGSLPGGGRGGVGNAPAAPSTTGAGATRASTGAGAPLGGMAGRGGQQQGDGDDTHERPEWLLDEHEPNELFGTDERTAPPVIGTTKAEQNPTERENKP